MKTEKGRYLVEIPHVPPSGVDPVEIALRAFGKHVELHPLGHYTGIVSLHGLARLGVWLKERDGDASVLDRARAHFAPFLHGEETFPCNFPNYRVGGNGAAFLWWRDELPGADEATFAPYIDELLHQAARDRDGIYCMPGAPEEEKIWIDVAFAVTPFLLFCGLRLGRDDCIEESWSQTCKLVDRLHVPATGLVNQAINFHAAGHRSRDHWSRGNGWAILALSELAQYFPQSHPERTAVEQKFKAFVEACLQAQDPVSGLWHQEMTVAESYIETSGSGLMLYALGAGIECGLLKEERHREAFEKGLRGLKSYVALDASVHNTCVGCLSPGMGTPEDYMRHPHRMNDPHAFGPLVLAFGQAARLDMDIV